MLIEKPALFDHLHLATLFNVETKTDFFLTSLPHQKIEPNLLTLINTSKKFEIFF